MMKVDLNEMFYVMIQQSEDTQMVRSWAPSRAGVGAVSCVTHHTMGGGYNQYLKYLVNTLNMNCGHQSLATVARTNITFEEGMPM